MSLRPGSSLLAAAALLAILSPFASAQTADGSALRLFSQFGSSDTHLIDSRGRIVHTWPSAYTTALSVDLLPDGSMLRAIGNAGPGEHSALERQAFDGTLLWKIDNPELFGHHDIEPMPNGNVLRIVWHIMTKDEAIAAGRDPALISTDEFVPERIIEVRPTGPTSGEVVWEWRVADHLIQDFDPTKANYGVVADHPELIDINYPPNATTSNDFNHINGLDYDPINDWIVLSSHTQDEIWIIDHSTTTDEAATHSGGIRGKGGDLLYRWGNPEAHQAGTAADKQLSGQHDPNFIPPGYPGAGHLIVFNNNYTATTSAVYELVLPVDAAGNFVLNANGRYGPAAPAWLYTASDFHSSFISGAERLPNGNTLICSGAQRWLFEVDPNGARVWEHTTSQLVFHVHHTTRSLWSDSKRVSQMAQDDAGLDLLAGSDRSGGIYLLVASAAGTSPGTMLGNLTLPLNYDQLLELTAASANSGVLVDTLGVLDNNGAGHAAIDLGASNLPSSLLGADIHVAYAVFDPNTATFTWTSNAVQIELRL